MYIVESQWSVTEILIQTVAMDAVEPQRPECGSLAEPTAKDIVEPTVHPASSAQMLDCYRNGNRRASEAKFGSACRIEDDCRGRSGTMVINESGEGKDNTIYQQKLA